jgi:hypothetical protein
MFLTAHCALPFTGAAISEASSTNEFKKADAPAQVGTLALVRPTEAEDLVGRRF